MLILLLICALYLRRGLKEKVKLTIIASTKLQTAPILGVVVEVYS